MGTRGAFGVRIDGTDKLSYNHFDSYPECLGDCMLAQAREIAQDLQGWKSLARSLKLVDEGTAATSKRIEKARQMGLEPDMRVHAPDRKRPDYYQLLRDAQGDLLTLLRLGFMPDANGFIYESLICEWGYIINLDDVLLEVYVGFQEKHHNLGRFATGKPSGHGGYYPCALIGEFEFHDLPESLTVFDPNR